MKISMTVAIRGANGVFMGRFQVGACEGVETDF